MGLHNRLKDLAISESGFIFDPYSGATYSVNEAGRRILERLRDGLEPERIAAELREGFELGPEDDPERDVAEFLILLRERGILPREAPR